MGRLRQFIGIEKTGNEKKKLENHESKARALYTPRQTGSSRSQQGHDPDLNAQTSSGSARLVGDGQQQSSPTKHRGRKTHDTITRKPVTSGTIRDNRPPEPRYQDPNKSVEDPISELSLVPFDHRNLANVGERSWLAEGDNRRYSRLGIYSDNRGEPSYDSQHGYRAMNVRRVEESPSKSEERRTGRGRHDRDAAELSQGEERQRGQTGYEEGDCDCKDSRDRISRRLYQFKQELPNERFAILHQHFARDIPRSCSFEDVEMTIDGLIRALQFSNQDADDRKNDLEMKMSECETLRRSQRELELRVSTLEVEKEKERESAVKITRLAMKEEHEEAQKEQQATSRKNQIYYEKWIGELEEVVTKLEKELTATREMADARIRNLETEKETWEARCQAQIEELGRVHQTEITAIQTIHHDAVNELKRSKELLADEHEGNLDKLKKHHDTERGQWDQKIIRIKEDCEDQKSQMRKEISKRDKEIIQVKENCENQKLLMRKEHDNMVVAIGKQKNEEKRRLEENVQSLKGVLVNRDGYKAMSDYKLAGRFQELTTDVDSFARVQWDASRVRTWPFSDKAFLNSENPRMDKQYLFQNTIWVILYEKIFFTPFRVLGKKGRSLEQQWAASYGEDRDSPGAQAHGPPPTLDSEKWRYEIIKDCLDAINRPLEKGDANYNVKRDYEESVNEATDDILKELSRVANVTEMNRQNFEGLVRGAAKFWLEVGQERYRLFLGMSASDGEPSRSGHTAVDRDGSQKLVVVPELRRIGDAQGKGLEIVRMVAGCQGVFSEFRSY